ncbi:MAG: AarF/ABC1/UbiB kinase family protein [Myxococcales bacterium]|nr:AarF/ABC1/UbiB kinase family protein [Myxococcales bacterium]
MPKDPKDDDKDKDQRDDESAHGGRRERMFSIGKMMGKAGGRILATKGAGLFRDKESRREKEAEMLAKVGQDFVKTSGRLKGAFMKIGQLLSTQHDLLPSEMVETLSELQADAPPMDWDLVRKQLETELGRPIEEAYATFEEDPVSSASLGQVHRGTLHDGTQVAVKIQYPGIDKAVEADLANLESSLKVFKLYAKEYDPKRVAREIRTHILMELDYVQEAENLALFHELYETRDDVVIPQVYPAYSSRRVLTMEYLDGYRLRDVMNAGADPELKNWLGETLVDLMWSQFLLHAVIHADPHPGNFLILPGPRLGLLDFGCVRKFDEDTRINFMKLGRAIVERDKRAMDMMFQRIGFYSDPKLAPVFEEIAYIWMLPYMEDRVFTIDEINVKEIAQRITALSMEHKIVNAPEETIMLGRVAIGLGGYLLSLRLNINVRPILERYLWPKELPIN